MQIFIYQKKEEDIKTTVTAMIIIKGVIIDNSASQIIIN